MRSLGPFLKDAWWLAKPYFKSEEKRSAWALLSAVLVLRLSLVGMTVVLSFWNREFFNALEAKDWDAFFDLLYLYRWTESGFMPGFCEVAAVYILVAVYFTYLQQWLQIRWRNWMTRQFLADWMTDRAYYRISLKHDAAQLGTDNPDQRIAEDIRDFIDQNLSLGIGFLANIVSLVSFIGILWGLSGTVTIFGVDIPGYMVWLVLIYAMIGTWLTHLIGRPLAALRFRQQRVEADFRYALVRVRENTEGIALYRGEAEETAVLRHRFSNVIGNWWGIMQRTKLLNAFIAGYDQAAVVFPFVIAAPRYFSGQIPLGALTQTAGSFARVQESLSWFISQYAELALWRSIVERLATFQRAIEEARAAHGTEFRHRASGDAALHMKGVTLALPNGTTLAKDIDLTLTPGHSVVITGASGSGKSTLFRALSGIWPFGHGDIEVPPGSFFLPQRPYIPLGTLRHVVTYPQAPERFTHQQIEAALRDAGLPRLVDRLDRDENWAQSLSGGEQQRVALARALLAKPEWIFLDEATASLDPEAEAHLYRTLQERLPDATLVSIAHRPSVARFHQDRLVFQREEGKPAGLVRGSVPVPGD
ncbi:MAG: ABC transporter ATP-binding protein/permease [Acetobacteraceae bacterium]